MDRLLGKVPYFFQFYSKEEFNLTILNITTQRWEFIIPPEFRSVLGVNSNYKFHQRIQKLMALSQILTMDLPNFAVLFIRGKKLGAHVMCIATVNFSETMLKEFHISKCKWKTCFGFQLTGSSSFHFWFCFSWLQEGAISSQDACEHLF